MTEDSPHPFETELDVIFRDIDALGHVNNAVYFTYMETARTRFIMQEMGLTGPTKLPLILASASCDFHKPARFGDTLRISLYVSRIGEKSFTLEYVISTLFGDLIATGTSVMVTFDYETLSTMPIPAALKKVLISHYQPESDSL